MEAFLFHIWNIYSNLQRSSPGVNKAMLLYAFRRPMIGMRQLKLIELAGVVGTNFVLGFDIILVF